MTDYFPYESVSKLDSKVMPNEALPSDQYLGASEPVAHFNEAMPTGVTVSQKGRIFVNFPRWGDKVSFTVAEVKEGKAIAYPDEPMNQSNRSDILREENFLNHLICFQVHAYELWSTVLCWLKHWTAGVKNPKPVCWIDYD